MRSEAVSDAVNKIRDQSRDVRRWGVNANARELLLRYVCIRVKRVSPLIFFYRCHSPQDYKTH